MSGANQSINSPLHRKSCNSTPEDITTFNANQFWSYSFHNTDAFLPVNMNNSGTISKTEESANNNNIKAHGDSDVQNVNNNISTEPTKNRGKSKENASSNSKPVTVPKNFNSLNELTEEELLILIEERRKAAEAADIKVVPNLNDGDVFRKSPHSNSEYSASTKGSSRRVSDTFVKKQETPVDLKRKSLPSSKNFLHGFLQSFILSGSKKETSPVEEVNDAVDARMSPNQKSPVDLRLRSVCLSPDEEVQAINAGLQDLAMEISPDREELPDNTSLNRTPVASVATSCAHTKGGLSKTAAGTPNSNAKSIAGPSLSPELQYPTDKDFGYVSPIPTNELFNPSLTFSDSPKVSCQSPILSCSFTDPAYQYIVSDTSDTGDSSFERDFDSDLLSFEDPALEKSPFIKYSVELRAKMAQRISVGDVPYKKPSPFLFSPRSSSNPKVYTSANDRNLHLLQEETTLDFESNDDLIPEEQNSIDALIEELKIAGEVNESCNDVSFPKHVDDVVVKKEEPRLIVAEKSDCKKTVWAQLVENIEMHIIRGNKAGFIASLNGHSLPCV